MKGRLIRQAKRRIEQRASLGANGCAQQGDTRRPALWGRDRNKARGNMTGTPVCPASLGKWLQEYWEQKDQKQAAAASTKGGSGEVAKQ